MARIALSGRDVTRLPAAPTEGTMQQDIELDEVLRSLRGADLYRKNVFRLTGLPTDASATLIRRRRDELALAEQLGAPLPPSSGSLPLLPAPDGAEVKAAFESLRNPVLRLVHELCWLWGEPGPHDEAVRAHCTALEGESITTPGRPDLKLDPLAKLWSTALANWAWVLSTDEIWDRARKRVREIDDPRLTTGTVRRLRERLPRHIVDVSVSLAAEAALEVATNVADRHLWLLDESPFDSDLVDAALFDAAAPAQERVRIACETASEAANKTPRNAVADVDELLRATKTALPELAVLLGSDDPITEAANDEVAKAANLCAISYYNATKKSETTLTLLAKARAKATDSDTIALLEKNKKVITEDQITGKVKDLCDSGKVNAAAVRLRVWRSRTDDPELRERINATLADPWALRAPITSVPTRFSINGFGTRLYGERSFTDDGKYVVTHFVTLLFIPVIPIAAYLRNDGAFYGKVPLSPFTRWWRTLAPSLLAVLLALWSLGETAAGITALVAAGITTLAQLWHRHTVIDWVDSIAQD